MARSRKSVTNVAEGLRKVIEELRTHSTTLTLSAKSLWSVPYERNLFFTGRQDILSRLASLLRTSQIMPPYAIHGLGGIGKTQTALEYVYRYQDEYQAIFWIRADSQEMIQTDLLAVAQVLNVQQTQEQPLVIGAVQRWLSDHKNWLLVFDNVEDVTIIQPFLYQKTGHILLTTRATAVNMVVQRIELNPMNIVDGTFFLLHRTNILPLDAPPDTIDPLDYQWAADIVQAMGGLPLALDQAGAFIEETQCSFEEYYQIFQQRQTDLLQRRGQYTGTHSDPVTTTWSLSLSKIQQSHPYAVDFLSLCAFLDPDSIPEDLFTHGAEELAPPLASIMQDPLAFRETIGLLLSYSLIHRNTNRTLTIHRLVQTVLRQRLDSQKQRDWAEHVVRIVNHVFPTVAYETWEQCRRYLPHALVCVSHIERYQMTFLEAARLLQEVGFYLHNHARYQEVEPLYLQALTISENVLGSEHAFTATILNKIANLYYAQGHHDKVEQFFQRALAIREKVLGQEHIDTAESLNGLARLYYVQARYTEAETLYRRALTIREMQLGPEAPLTADSIHHLAVLYHAQKRYSEADSLYQQVLSIREQILGPEHPETLDTLDCLARLRHSQGQYTHLEPLYQRVLAIRKKILGPEHPRTAISIDSLAWFYQDQKHYAQAEVLYQQALEIRKKVLGPQHPDVAVSLDCLATLYNLQGQYILAETAYKEALNIREQIKGLEHPYTLQSFRALVDFYSNQGQYDQAELLYQQGLLLREEKLGMKHPQTALFLQDYITFLRTQQRLEEVALLEARVQTMPTN